MAGLGLSSTGRCRCGDVVFKLSGPPMITGACHCRGCQQMTSSAFSLSSMFAADAFAVIQGEPVAAGTGAGGHMACPRCKTWLFTKPAEAPQFVNVRAILLDDAASFVPFMETQTAEKLPWASTPAVRSFERFPQMSEYEELLTEYSAWAKNPA